VVVARNLMRRFENLDRGKKKKKKMSQQKTSRERKKDYGVARETTRELKRK